MKQTAHSIASLLSSDGVHLSPIEIRRNILTEHFGKGGIYKHACVNKAYDLKHKECFIMARYSGRTLQTYYSRREQVLARWVRREIYTELFSLLRDVQ